MTAPFSLLDTITRAKVAFDGQDYATAAGLFQLAADFATKMDDLQEEMMLLDAELSDRINKDQSK